MTDPPERAPDDACETLLVEFVVKMNSGDRPDVEEYCSRLADDGAREDFRGLVRTVQWARDRFPRDAGAGEVLGGRYRILRQLGTGGFGSVWEAVDEKLDDRPVAVKILNAPAHGQHAAKLLERERKALGRVDHPGVVGIRDVGEHRERPFLVMDRVEGTGLDAVIASVRRATPPGAAPTLDALRDAIGLACPPGHDDLVGDDSYWRAVARLLGAILYAVEAAHAKGVVHRDLKPRNVMLQGGGHPVVLDFGIAALDAAGSGLFTGRLIGTTIYVAPEQITNQRLGADTRTDVYQLGLILYELIALRPAFDPKGTVTATLDKIRNGSLKPPREIEPIVPPALEAVCLRAVAVDPDQRYQDVAAFRHDLESIARGEDPRPPRPSQPPTIPDDRFEFREELQSDPRVHRWRAYDRLLGREVELEQAGEALAGRIDTTVEGKRALCEAQALARLDHPGIVRLYELQWSDGRPLLVLQARSGETLAELLTRRGRLEPDEVVRLGAAMADAVHAVHAVGIVHRGISARNVRLDATEGHPILGGFGFAKPFDRAGALSSLHHRHLADDDAAAKGLPDYAAPEQIAGQPADARADVFALGCLLYRCATGEEAFGVDQVEWTEPRPLRGLAPGVPRHVADSIHRAMNRGPASRFPTMTAFRDALTARAPARPPRRWWRLWARG